MIQLTIKGKVTHNMVVLLLNVLHVCVAVPLLCRPWRAPLDDARSLWLLAMASNHTMIMVSDNQRPHAHPCHQERSPCSARWSQPLGADVCRDVAPGRSSAVLVGGAGAEQAERSTSTFLGGGRMELDILSGGGQSREDRD